jgi:hypothetical protein
MTTREQRKASLLAQISYLTTATGAPIRPREEVLAAKPKEPEVERWRDGTPKDPIAAALERIDLERFEQDAAYASEHLQDFSNLLRARAKAERDARQAETERITSERIAEETARLHEQIPGLAEHDAAQREKAEALAAEMTARLEAEESERERQLSEAAQAKRERESQFAEQVNEFYEAGGRGVPSPTRPE